MTHDERLKQQTIQWLCPKCRAVWTAVFTATVEATLCVCGTRITR